MARKELGFILLLVAFVIITACSGRDIQGSWLFTMSQEQLFEGQDIIRTYTLKGGKILLEGKPCGTYTQDGKTIAIILDMDIPELPKVELRGNITAGRSMEGDWITFFHKAKGPFPGTQWSAIKK